MRLENLDKLMLITFLVKQSLEHRIVEDTDTKMTKFLNSKVGEMNKIHHKSLNTLIGHLQRNNKAKVIIEN
jgi:hypothetical protein